MQTVVYRFWYIAWFYIYIIYSRYIVQKPDFSRLIVCSLYSVLYIYALRKSAIHYFNGKSFGSQKMLTICIFYANSFQLYRRHIRFVTRLHSSTSKLYYSSLQYSTSTIIYYTNIAYIAFLSNHPYCLCILCIYTHYTMSLNL